MTTKILAAAAVALSLTTADIARAVILYQNDFSTSNFDLINNPPDHNNDGLPDFIDVSDPVPNGVGGFFQTTWIDGGIGSSHGGNGAANGAGRWSIGTESGNGATLQWDDSSVNYDTDIVRVSFWVSHELSQGGPVQQPFVSGRRLWVGLGNGAVGDQFEFTNVRGNTAGISDFLFLELAHDNAYSIEGGDNCSACTGFHRRSSGGGLNSSRTDEGMGAAAFRGLWDAYWDDVSFPGTGGLPATFTDKQFFQVMFEVDLTGSEGSDVVDILAFDPQSGDTEPLVVGRFDLSNLNAADRFNRLRLETFGSTIPEYHIDDVLVEFETVVRFDPGDFNKDGRIDGDDFLLWQAGFNQFDPSTNPASQIDGDADGDGDVDGDDFLIWQQGFAPEGGAAASVPEPNAVILVGLLLTSVAARRRSC